MQDLVSTPRASELPLLSSTMSTNRVNGAPKSRKSAAKVGGEFVAVGGIVIVGGVLVAGIAAAAIACLRRRPRKMLENSGEKPGENSSLEDKLAVPMSEKVEEVQPILEIADMEKLSVENFSSMDLELSANEKSINRSKGDESPRSHFSLSASSGTSASVSSDSEDLLEINQMSFKENGSVPLDETCAKASFDIMVGRESECIGGKELAEANVEYEESVDSFDGLEDSEEVGGQTGNDCEESGQSSLVCEKRFDADKRVEFVSGYREDDKVCVEDDGSMHVERFHVPIEGIDEADVSCGGRIVEIDVLKAFEFLKGDLCLDREEKDQMGTDANDETVLFSKEDLKEEVGGSEGLNCDKEDCRQAIIDRGEYLTSVKEDCSEDIPRRGGNSSVDFGHGDERGEHGEVDISEECFSPIRQQSQQEMVGTNQEVVFCEEECLQEKFESNEGRFGKENTDSEESDNYIVNAGYKEEQCGTVLSRDFEGLDYNRYVSHCEENCQPGGLEFSEENSCHTEEGIHQESVKPKEIESTEVDEYCCQGAAPHESSNAKEEAHFCKEKHPEQKTFESNVEQYLRERANLEHKPEGREVDFAHKAEQCQHETVDSRGFEVLDYEGGYNHPEESGQQKEEGLEQNCSPINETAQSKELECREAEVHDLQDRHGQVSVDVNDYELPCKEQSIQEENLELNVKQCPQEKTDTEDDLKSERCRHGTVDFWGLEGLDYKGVSINYDEIGQHGELEDSEENLFPINKQSQKETLKHRDLDCREVEVPGHQDGHESEPDDANKEEKFVMNVEQCSQEKTDCIAAVANKGEQCQIETVDSRNFGGLDEDALHENGSCQYGAVGPRELDDLNRDSYSEKGQFENERLNLKEDIQNEQFENGSLESKEDTENEQFRNGKLNSKEVVELDIDLEENLSLQEQNIKEPREALEVSVMGMECEENAVNSKETDGDGDAHIFKERLNLEEDTQHEQFENGSLNSKEDTENEQSENGRLNSKEVVELDIGLEEKQSLQEENIKEPQEALEVSVMEMECEENAVNSKETGVDGDADILKGMLNLKEDIRHEDFENGSLNSNEDTENEQSENGRLNSKEVVELDIGLEEKLSLQEENIKEPQEASEVSVMEMECEENAVNSKETGIDGNAHISKERLNLKEDIQNEKFENGSLQSKEDTENEQFENGRLNSEEIVELDIGLEEKLGLQEENIKEPQEASEVSVMEMECEENAVNSKETGIDGNAHIFKERLNLKEDIQRDQFENGSLKSEEDKENGQSENGRLNSKEVVEMDIGLEEKLSLHKENIKEPQEALEVSVVEVECYENAVNSKKTGVDGDADILKGMLNLKVNIQNEKFENGSLKSKEATENEQFENGRINSKEVLELDIGLEEKLSLQEENIEEPQEALEVSVMEVESEGNAVNSKETGVEGDAHIFKERLNLKEDIQHEQFENGSLKSKEDAENEQFENGRLNSKEVLELDIGLEEKQSLQEENIKEPQEALEVSFMEMECEENAVNSKETSVDEDAHIFKEKPQEESMNSNESQNFVEDIIVNHERCKGTCESEESEFGEENMPIAQEEYKREIVNSVDIQDSVKCILVTTLQCDREINESDKLEDLSIHGEKYKGDAVYLERLELSDNLHSYNELGAEEERLGKQSSPSQKEIVAFKETNNPEYLNQLKQSQETEIDVKDLRYSSSIVLELSPNDPDCSEAYESFHEDPQTYNKPKVIGTKVSEYSYGHSIEKEKYQLETVDQVEKQKYQLETVDEVEKEKYQLETADQVANNYFRENKEIYPEQEEVNEENSSTRTHHLNNQNEANQDISTSLKEIKLDDESTESKSVTPSESEQREVLNTNSVTEREKKGWDPLHSSQLVSNTEDDKSLQMKPQRPLYTRTRIIVSLFAALLAFLLTYKLSNMPEIVYAT